MGYRLKIAGIINGSRASLYSQLSAHQNLRLTRRCTFDVFAGGDSRDARAERQRLCAPVAAQGSRANQSTTGRPLGTLSGT